MSTDEKAQLKWPIVGHSSIIDYLKNSIISENLAHAYLFVGHEGVGKSTVARYFINSLLCKDLESHKKEFPCGSCRCCEQINSKSHPDIYTIDKEFNEKTQKLKKNISVEQIRELLSKLSMGSFMDSYKIAIINDAQFLSIGAANSLLKTLEEPTKKTILVLLATNTKNIPKTILSRCQVLNFLPVSVKEIEQYIHGEYKFDAKKSRRIALASYGNPGLAIELAGNAEKVSQYQEEIKEVINLVKGGLVDKFSLVNEVVKNREVDDIQDFLTSMQKILRDAILVKQGLTVFVANKSFETIIESSFENYSLEQLIKILKEINQAKGLVNDNANFRVVLENLAISF